MFEGVSAKMSSRQINCQPDLKSSAPLFDADDFKLADNLADEKRDRDRQKCPSTHQPKSSAVASAPYLRTTYVVH